MKLETIIPLLIIALILVVAGYKYYKRKYWFDIKSKWPAVKRTDLLIGPYGSWLDQMERIAAYTNLHWFMGRYPVSILISELKTHFWMKVAFDVSYLIHDEGPMRGRKLLPDAKARLRAAFQEMSNAGVLHRIKYLIPVDEPQLWLNTELELRLSMVLLRDVAYEFPELANVQFAVIYLEHEPFWAIEMFDVVGIDCYKQKSESLTRGEHARLLKAKRPTQKTILVPGPTYDHQPDPWMAYAHSHPEEVVAVAPFMYTSAEGITGLEHKPTEFRLKWLESMRDNSALQQE